MLSTKQSIPDGSVISAHNSGDSFVSTSKTQVTKISTLQKENNCTGFMGYVDQVYWTLWGSVQYQ